MKLLAVNAVDHPGGAEVGLLRLTARLRERDWEVTLTSPREGPLERGRRTRGCASTSAAWAAGEGARAVASWPRALRLAQRFDVVYLNSTVCGRLLPALRGVRSVLHVHDIVDRVPRHWAQADVVLADSQAVADRLDGLDAHVVYCPVELDPPPAEAPWAHANGGPVVGFVGRIEPRKGVLDLIAAAPAIRAASPGAEVVIVGDDPWDAFPDYLAQVRAARDVVHVPWHDNAPGLMRHFDVLVAPSHQEPFGTVISRGDGGRHAGRGHARRRPRRGRRRRRDRRCWSSPGEPAALAAAVLDVLGAGATRWAPPRARPRSASAPTPTPSASSALVAAR